MVNTKENRGTGLLWILAIYSYVIIAAISAVIFNYQYAREHGFLSWLLFGELVATIKGALWIFFVW